MFAIGCGVAGMRARARMENRNERCETFTTMRREMVNEKKSGTEQNETKKKNTTMAATTN